MHVLADITGDDAVHTITLTFPPTWLEMTIQGAGVARITSANQTPTSTFGRPCSFGSAFSPYKGRGASYGQAWLAYVPSGATLTVAYDA